MLPSTPHAVQYPVRPTLSESSHKDIPGRIGEDQIKVSSIVLKCSGRLSFFRHPKQEKFKLRRSIKSKPNSSAFKSVFWNVGWIPFKRSIIREIYVTGDLRLLRTPGQNGKCPGIWFEEHIRCSYPRKTGDR
jgi:hypothetical protein